MGRDGVTRRGLLGWVGAALGTTAAVRPRPSAAAASAGTAPRSELDVATLRRCADVLLPSELSAAERDAAVTAFGRWVDGYQGDAEMDHGYGFTRLRRTAPPPGPGYADDLRALQHRARIQNGRDLVELDNAALGALVAVTIDDAAPDRTGLPGRPDDSHVLIAFMSHWYRSPTGTDHAYGMRIGRESCRGLFTDVDGLEPLAGD